MSGVSVIRAFIQLAILGTFLGRASFAGASEASEREIEARLLHRRFPFGDLQSYARTQQVWKPLRAAGARIYVVNLWSKPCMPCLAELPELAKLAKTWKPHSRDVQFLFVADPPEQTSAEDVVVFWARPYADGLARDCPGTKMQRQGTPSCLLELPDEDPARSASGEVTRALLQIETRPLTLLIDEQGTIRQVFAGSVRGPRLLLLESAIKQLLQAVEPRAAGPARRAGTR